MIEVCDYSQGVQVDVSKQFDKKINENNVRFLRIIDFTQGNQEIRYIEDPGNRYFLKINELAMVRYGASTGFICLGLEGAIANNLFKISLKKQGYKISYLYLYFKSNFFQSKLKAMISGAAMPALNFGMLNEMQIPVLDIDVQNKMEMQLESIKRNIFNHKIHIKKINALISSLQSQAFTTGFNA